jgi:hypothetical protein
VIGALVRLRNGLSSNGTTKLAVVARRQPRQGLRLTSVDEVMPVHENMADALHAVNGARWRAAGVNTR